MARARGDYNDVNLVDGLLEMQKDEEHAASPTTKSFGLLVLELVVLEMSIDSFRLGTYTPHPSNFSRSQMRIIPVLAVRKLLWVIAILLATIIAPNLYADSITNVAASVSFSGNPNLGFGTGLGVNESFSTTFQWDATTGNFVPNSVVVTTVGPIGPFTANIVVGIPYQPVINFYDAAGSFIQIYDTDYFEATGMSLLSVPGVYTPNDFFFIQCGPPDCPTPTNGANPSLAISPLLVVSPTPEPETLALTLIGTGLLGLMVMRKRGEQNFPRAR
jgi:hypothetical protein